MSQEDIYKTFARVTRNFASDIRDYRAIMCTDVSDDGQELIGQTAFFRHYRVMHELLASIKKPERLRILAAPASIGCEAYSLARLSIDLGIGDVRIDAFDISKTFTELARVGAYPRPMMLRVGNDKDDVFARAPDDSLLVPVQDELKERVRFLEPCKFQDFAPREDYDVVLIGNLFQHLTGGTEVQACLDVVKKTNASLVVMNKKGTPKPDGVHFVDIRAVHPTWRLDKVFDSYQIHLSHYAIWARKDAFKRPKAKNHV